MPYTSCCGHIFGDVVRLEGIAVDPDCQQKGVGVSSLALAMQQANAAGAVAVTRNPATVGLVARCTQLVSPVPRIEDAMINAGHPLIQQIVETYANDIGCAKGALPIIEQRYPDDLYGNDPGLSMNIPELVTNQNAGVIVAGIGRSF